MDLFDKNHRKWANQDWGHVFFREEPKFCLNPDDTRVKVCRSSGERYAEFNIVRKVGKELKNVVHLGLPLNLSTRYNFTNFLPVNKGKKNYILIH